MVDPCHLAPVKTGERSGQGKTRAKAHRRRNPREKGEFLSLDRSSCHDEVVGSMAIGSSYDGVPADQPGEIDSKDQSKPPSPEGILNSENGSRVDEGPLFFPGSLQRSTSGHSLDVASSVIQRDDSSLSDDVQCGLYETRPSGVMKGPCDESQIVKGPIAAEPGWPPLLERNYCSQASSGPAPILSFSEIVVRNLNLDDLPIDNVLPMPISNEDRLDAIGNHSKAHEIFFSGGSAHCSSPDVQSHLATGYSMALSDATGFMARKISGDIPLPDGAMGALRVDQPQLLAASVSSGPPDAHLLGTSAACRLSALLLRSCAVLDISWRWSWLRHLSLAFYGGPWSCPEVGCRSYAR
ncbi:hypothetical protein Nepgr_012488 [Nepenthes gracilis]|uniref:Uncharacterized protein n=1 Tax=Nepenthes gracilis TaxID=150966 RepID=A0AAD3XMU6_NEPGR|nr:hypothetical protein Nepgr_012488 [Nepenthes gracilis]